MRTKILSVFLVLPLFAFASFAYAVDKPVVRRVAVTRTGMPLKAQTHLTEARLKSCQARESAITQRMASLVDLVKNMETKFDAIALRVEDFYTSTVVPSGKTVANYNALVANIQTKKDAVQKNVDLAQANASKFSCITDDPKGLFTQFRLDMQAVKKSLQDYRTSIKNLIVAVHKVVGETEEATPSASPKPTEAQ